MRRGAFTDRSHGNHFAEHGARNATNEGQRVRVFFLRHDQTDARVAIRQLYQPEFLGIPDLQILGETVEMEEDRHQIGHHLKRLVNLPHGVTGVSDRLGETQ
ncbi:MAG TPA: hypothetical protein DCG06_00620 [Deltaproteobacteria bacterium]|nr:hypothetical protein [Deltaproteobacteria bacterium]